MSETEAEKRLRWAKNASKNAYMTPAMQHSLRMSKQQSNNKYKEGYDKTKGKGFTSVSSTPVIENAKKQSKLVSQNKYKSEFEKNKAKFTPVADDPETLRAVRAGNQISNIAYLGKGNAVSKSTRRKKDYLTKYEPAKPAAEVTPDPITSDPVAPDPVTLDPVTAGPVAPDSVNPDPVAPDSVTSDPMTPDPDEQSEEKLNDAIQENGHQVDTRADDAEEENVYEIPINDVTKQQPEEETRDDVTEPSYHEDAISNSNQNEQEDDVNPSNQNEQEDDVTPSNQNEQEDDVSASNQNEQEDDVSPSNQNEQEDDVSAYQQSQQESSNDVTDNDAIYDQVADDQSKPVEQNDEGNHGDEEPIYEEASGSLDDFYDNLN